MTASASSSPSSADPWGPTLLGTLDSMLAPTSSIQLSSPTSSNLFSYSRCLTDFPSLPSPVRPSQSPYDDVRGRTHFPTACESLFVSGGTETGRTLNNQNLLASCPYRNVSSHRPPALALHLPRPVQSFFPNIASTACRQSHIIISFKRKCKIYFSRIRTGKKGP